MTGYAVLEPLIRRKVFADEQVAVRLMTMPALLGVWSGQVLGHAEHVGFQTSA
jgi:hypothetical protein